MKIPVISEKAAVFVVNRLSAKKEKEYINAQESKKRQSRESKKK